MNTLDQNICPQYLSLCYVNQAEWAQAMKDQDDEDQSEMLDYEEGGPEDPWVNRIEEEREEIGEKIDRKLNPKHLPRDVTNPLMYAKLRDRGFLTGNPNRLAKY